MFWTWFPSGLSIGKHGWTSVHTATSVSCYGEHLGQLSNSRINEL